MVQKEMSLGKKSKEKVIKENFFENISYNNEEELILTKEQVKNLENDLSNLEVDEKTKRFFKSSFRLYKKMEENEFKITLEELEKGD